MDLPKILKTKITRENFVLVGILVILLAIPLTVILLGIRQELRKRAEGVNGAILINNGAETTNSRNVTLTLTAPSGQQSFLKVPQAHAADCRGCNEVCHDLTPNDECCPGYLCTSNATTGGQFRCRAPGNDPSLQIECLNDPGCGCYTVPTPPTPSPTQVPGDGGNVEDYGCTLECAPDASLGPYDWAYTRCLTTVTTDEHFPQRCTATWDGEPLPVGPSYCVALVRRVCYESFRAHTETHVAAVTVGRTRDGKSITCSDEITVDCPDQRVCLLINGPAIVQPGSQNSYRSGALYVEENATFVWSASCGSDLSGQTGREVIWTAPSEETSCTISNYVIDTDGTRINCPSRTIEVDRDAPIPTLTPAPTPVPSNCNEACASQGYDSGYCDILTEERPLCESSETNVGWAQDCQPDSATPRACCCRGEGTGETQMMISNSQDFQGAVEELFASTKSWTLTENDGTKTVWAKFKVGGVWTTPVSDSITLSTGGPTPTPTPTTPPGTPTPTPTPPPGGYLKLDLLKVWFWKQEGALGRGHAGSVVLVLKQGGSVVLEKEVKLDENGEARSVELPGVSAGTYDAFIYEAGYLTKKLSNATVGESGNTLDFTKGGTEYFLVGDFNGDQEVNILDFSIFVKSYGKQGDEPR